MRKEDLSEFCQMLDDCYALLARGGAMPSATAKAMFFRALDAYPLSAVRSAFDAHVKDPQRGRFAPTPADLVAQLEGMVADDGRPGPEEAWALVARARDESETVVWSEEMAQAWKVSSSIMEMGDEVGARMAFKESYIRHVQDARALRKPVVWSASLGHDPSKRAIALTRAEAMGLIAHDDVLRLAPPERGETDPVALLLESAHQAADPQTVRERVATLKRLLERPQVEERSIEDMRRAVLERRKEQMAKVSAYAERFDIDLDPPPVIEPISPQESRA